MSEQTIALEQGDSGAEVTALQSALVQRGYSLAIDGAYGAQTTEVVRQWKLDNSNAILGPIQDGSYVTRREFDLISALEIGQDDSGTDTAGGGGQAGQIVLIGAATALGIVLALDE